MQVHIGYSFPLHPKPGLCIVHAVIKPKREELDWISKTSPGMRQSMVAMQHLANSIAQEWGYVRSFNALGPDALLACAVLVDEAMQSQQQ